MSNVYQDMIRHQFYKGSNVTHSPTEDMESGELRGTRAHARHCFDYLRQTVQCAADTNLEPVDFRLGGVKGWTEHVCKDFEAVRKMAAEQRPERVDALPRAQEHQ